MAGPSRIALIPWPTPLHRLDQASADLGVDLWIKRDDLTGFALGGNKGRKLEYLMADAVASGASRVVTCGSLQSNFVRQLGAAASVLGMSCSAVVMELPYDTPAGKPEAVPQIHESGNVLIDDFLGVELKVLPDGDWELLFAAAEALAQEKEKAGEKVYRIPVGGSSPLGAYAYYRAADELRGHPKFDYVIVACSSGSTLTGLGYAFHGSPTRVIGISCDPEPALIDVLGELGEGLREWVDVGDVATEYWDLRMEYVGPGYGVPSLEGNAAIHYLAKAEGVFLDPIYTAKAFAGLKDLVIRRQIKGRILFWHTGGIPSLFAFPKDAYRAD